jgi:Tol biopolymer transport system component
MRPGDLRLRGRSTACVIAAALGVALAAASPASSAFWGRPGKIAFQSGRDGNYNIFSTAASPSSPDKRLTGFRGGDFAPAWSPDGSRILFDSNRSGNLDIYSIGANGGGLMRLTDNVADDWQPAWSPDGQRIAFQRSRAGN